MPLLFGCCDGTPDEEYKEGQSELQMGYNVYAVQGNVFVFKCSGDLKRNTYKNHLLNSAQIPVYYLDLRDVVNTYSI